MERRGNNTHSQALGCSRRAFISQALIAPILAADASSFFHQKPSKITGGAAAKPAVKIECVAGCGTGSLGGPAKEARLIEPFGVAFDRGDKVGKGGSWYICEYKGQR